MPTLNFDTANLPFYQMEEALYHKFTQHLDLKAELLGTGNAELVEVGVAHVRFPITTLKSTLCRTPIRMRSGASVQIDEVETNLEKLSRDFAPNSERDNRSHRFGCLEASSFRPRCVPCLDT